MEGKVEFADESLTLNEMRTRLSPDRIDRERAIEEAGRFDELHGSEYTVQLIGAQLGRPGSVDKKRAEINADLKTKIEAGELSAEAADVIRGRLGLDRL